MKSKLLGSIKSLLLYWVINFIVIGLGMALIVFVCAPFAMIVITKTVSAEFLPNRGDIYKSIDFVLFAAFWSGLVLWAKVEFFTEKENLK